MYAFHFLPSDVKPDFSKLNKMRVGELKKILSNWGEDNACKGCAEKSDFVKKVKELLPKYDPEEWKKLQAAEKSDLWWPSLALVSSLFIYYFFFQYLGLEGWEKGGVGNKVFNIQFVFKMLIECSHFFLISKFLCERGCRNRCRNVCEKCCVFTYFHIPISGPLSLN